MRHSPGLRERKKAETRSALGSAALFLALERGPEIVTADDIASAAHVSPRTFHNYYANKEEALIVGWRSILHVYVDQLLARPADESILESLYEVFAPIAAQAVARREETEAHLDLLFNPALTRYRALLVEEAVKALAEIVAGRTGTDASADVYPRLVATTAISAVVIAYDVPPDVTSDPDELARRLRQAFDLLRTGLGQPTAGST
jgi:AcrR family transcriptional regulator